MSGYETARWQFAGLIALVALQFIWGVVCLAWLGGTAGYALLAFNWVLGAWNGWRIAGLYDYMWHGRLW